MASKTISKPLIRAAVASISTDRKAAALIEYARISSKTDKSARIAVTISCA